GTATYLSYAVRGYFENGGQVAYVLRVGRMTDADDGALPRPFVCARRSITLGAITLNVFAASPGAWGNHTRVVFSLKRAGVGVPEWACRDSPSAWKRMMSPTSSSGRSSSRPARSPESLATRSWIHWYAPSRTALIAYASKPRLTTCKRARVNNSAPTGTPSS